MNAHLTCLNMFTAYIIDSLVNDDMAYRPRSLYIRSFFRERRWAELATASDIEAFLATNSLIS